MRNITSQSTGVPEFIYVPDKISVLHSSIELIPLTAKSYQGKGKNVWFTEPFLSKAIAKKFKGTTEHCLKNGDKIDVLTDSAVIECKVAKNWKNGIGQVLSYGYHYPEREKWLILFSVNESHVLFGEEDNTPPIVDKLNEIASICLNHGISLKLVSEVSFLRTPAQTFKKIRNPEYPS